MGEDYKIMGGQGWPWMTENQIGPSMGYRTPLARHHPEWGAVGQSSGQDGYVRAEALVDELLDLDRPALKHVPACLPFPILFVLMVFGCRQASARRDHQPAVMVGAARTYRLARSWGREVNAGLCNATPVRCKMRPSRAIFGPQWRSELAAATVFPSP